MVIQIRQRGAAHASGRERFSQIPDTLLNASSRRSRGVSQLALFIIVVSLAARPLQAQTNHQQYPDSIKRWHAYGRSMVKMAIGGVGYATWDQIWIKPEEWGGGWSGYGKRVASNIGATWVQETVTHGLAAVMNRPVTYLRCPCNGTGDRFVWAMKGTVMDQMPNNRFKLAVPRIVGGYAGAYARTTWWPETRNSRLESTLIDGTATLGVSALINLTYEFIFR